MNRVFLDLGFIKIYWYSIMILLGAFLGITLVYREFKRLNIDTKKLDNMAFYTIIFGLIGARIWYVLFNLSYYSHNILEIFAVWHGGLAIHGGIFGGLLFLYFYCRKKNYSFIKITDIVMPAVLIGQIVGRWGNFFNMEAHGGEVTRTFLEKLCIPDFIIKGMFIGGKYYHPTFLYESIFNLIVLIIILLVRRNKKIKEGCILSIYLIGYGIIRFFIEGLRTDSLMLGSIRVAQLISIVFVIVGLIMLFISIKKMPYYNKEEEKQEEPKANIEEEKPLIEDTKKATNKPKTKKETKSKKKKNTNTKKKKVK